METMVASVQQTTDAEGQTTMGVTTSMGEAYTASVVVLALPRRSLELIDCAVLVEPAVRSLVSSVTGQHVMKLFCCYESPW